MFRFVSPLSQLSAWPLTGSIILDRTTQVTNTSSDVANSAVYANDDLVAFTEAVDQGQGLYYQLSFAPVGAPLGYSANAVALGQDGLVWSAGDRIIYRTSAIGSGNPVQVLPVPGTNAKAPTASLSVPAGCKLVDGAGGNNDVLALSVQCGSTVSVFAWDNQATTATRYDLPATFSSPSTRIYATTKGFYLFGAAAGSQVLVFLPAGGGAPTLTNVDRFYDLAADDAAAFGTTPAGDGGTKSAVARLDFDSGKITLLTDPTATNTVVLFQDAVVWAVPKPRQPGETQFSIELWARSAR
jgi:hypothetical protein